ncbi:MAG: DinB family protein [Terriglobales bacterium]
MSVPTSEFVLGYRAMMLDSLAREVAITKRVLAAVPDGKRDYKPYPHARTAWELAWHIASTDVHFLNSIADLKLDVARGAEADKPKTVAELVDWYDRNMKRGLNRVRALSATQLATPIPFFTFNFPAAFYLGVLNNHSIHHRGELTTYLHPMGSKVPSIYLAIAVAAWK